MRQGALRAAGRLCLSLAAQRKDKSDVATVLEGWGPSGVSNRVHGDCYPLGATSTGCLDLRCRSVVDPCCPDALHPVPLQPSPSPTIPQKMLPRTFVGHESSQQPCVSTDVHPRSSP